MTAERLPTKAKRVTQPHMSEQQLLDAVVALAHARGYLVFHARPSLRADGEWRTATQGDKGFPDLTIIRVAPPKPVLPPNSTLEQEMAFQRALREQENIRQWCSELHPRFVELKSARGKVSPEQQKWLDALGPYACVWRPADWHSGRIAEALR